MYGNRLTGHSVSSLHTIGGTAVKYSHVEVGSGEYQRMFTNRTKALVWGMQTRAVQSMLDFDFICRYVC